MKERKIAKTVMKRFGKAVICTGLAAVITGGMLAGCAVRGTDAQQTTPSEIMGSVPMDTTPAVTTIAETTAVLDTTPAETTVLVTMPVETTVLETTPAEVTVPDTTPVKTTPAETQPPVTTPKATEPAATKPEATQPKPTEPQTTAPAHNHSYQATNTVAPGCTSQGYTEYTCSCGSTVKRDYTAALGHSYTVTQSEATCQAGGCTVHTCERCGNSYTDGYTDKLAHSMEDTTVDGCPVKKCRWCDTQEFTEATLAWLKQYAIDYAVSLGYEYCPGLRDGYYPGVSRHICSVADGKRFVKSNVDAQTHQLEACGCEIAKVMEDGTIARFLFDFAIEPEGDGWYCLWSYYG
ncbi:MAG: hypothetical protein ACI3W5_01960 [Faecousia sp.]